MDEVFFGILFLFFFRNVRVDADGVLYIGVLAGESNLVPLFLGGGGGIPHNRQISRFGPKTSKPRKYSKTKASAANPKKSKPPHYMSGAAEG